MLNELRIFTYLATILGVSGCLFYAQLRPDDRRLMTLRPIALAVCLLGFCFVVPTLLELDLLLLFVLPLYSRSRVDAACLFLAATLALPTLDIPIVIGSQYILNFSATTSLSLSLMLAFLIKSGDKPPSVGRSDLGFILLFVLTTALTARGTTIGDGLRQSTSSALVILPAYYCISRALCNGEDVKRFLLTFALIGFCFSVEAVYESRRALPVFALITGHYGTDKMAYLRVAIRTRGGVMRAAGSFLEPIGFSAFLAFTIAAILSLQRSFISRGRYYSILGLATLGLLSTVSRGGWLMASFGLLSLDVFRRRYASVVAKTVILGAVSILIVLSAQVYPGLSQTFGFSGSALDTAQYRQQLASRGLDEFKKAPIIGRDGPTVVAAMADMKQGEGIVDLVNGWLYFLLFGGIVGTAIFVASLVVPAGALLHARGPLNRRQDELAITGFLFTAILMEAVLLLTGGYGGRPAWLYIFFLAVSSALLAIVRRDAPLAMAARRQGQSAVSISDPARLLAIE